MIDDKYLNGYAKLCGWKATLVYISLCRHANRDQFCFPSIKLIAKELSISEKSVQRGIEDLKKWNIVDVKKEKWKNGLWKNNSYILLDKSVWQPKPIQETVRDVDSQESISPKPQDSQGVDQETESPIKEINKEENTFKETHIGNASVAGGQVNEIMDIFSKINPTLNWGNKTIRNAAADLIRQFGLGETKSMAEAAVSIQGQSYAPTVTTPWELKEKLAKVKAFFDRQKNDQIAKKPRVSIIS